MASSAPEILQKQAKNTTVAAWQVSMGRKNACSDVKWICR
jgi:hypothetical protein